MPKRSSKPPTDASQRARAIVDLATAEPSENFPITAPAVPEKNPAAVALGKLGGAKGGPARAKALSKRRRAEIAQKAARARWKRST